MVMTAFMVVGCTGGSSDRSDGAVVDDLEPEAIEPGEDDVELLAGQAGVDEVVRMNPPTRFSVPAGLGPTGTILSSRAILSIATPDGPADMFEVVVDDSDMGEGPQHCMVLAQRNSGAASCNPVGQGEVQVTGMAGASGDDHGTIYEFTGPTDMTHFVIAAGESRLMLLTRDGHALFYVAQAFCEGKPEIESAWRGDTELAVDNPSTC